MNVLSLLLTVPRDGMSWNFLLIGLVVVVGILLVWWATSKGKKMFAFWLAFIDVSVVAWLSGLKVENNIILLIWAIIIILPAAISVGMFFWGPEKPKG